MMKITGVFIVFLTVFCIIVPGIAEASANGTVDFSIRFFDRRIYYAETDPVLIQITVTNNTPATYRFKLADERAFSIDFDVRTTTNRPLEPAESLIRKRTQYQQVFFREIAVEAGESFSFVEDLRDFVKLGEPGAFVVSAKLHPELYRTDAADRTAAISVPVLESRRLSLNIRPPVIPGPDGVPLDLDVATGAVLAREKIAPDQVVDYMITARQRSQWERFFLYLDLEAMISNNSARRREWQNESAEGRRRMVERFRQELRAPIVDNTISVVPTEYVIERTQYNNSEGTVVVLKRFRTGNFTDNKRYTYILQRKDDIWMIVDYSVTHLGTQ